MKELMSFQFSGFLCFAICKEHFHSIHVTVRFNECVDLQALSSTFMDRWEKMEPAFVTYCKKEWHNKVSTWTIKFRQYKHANQNTNGGVEWWHHTLKQELKIDKYTISGCTIIWLLLRTAALENHYYCIGSLKFQGRIRNRTIEKYVWDSIHRARAISDEHVVVFQYED